MAPLVRRLRAQAEIEVQVCLTGQHREMIVPINSAFGIEEDFDLEVIKPGQSLPSLSASLITKLEHVFTEVKPDITIIQGDTMSAFCGAFVAFLSGSKVVHLEAGLRSGNPRNPFPEEANRKLVGQITDLHLAPTKTSRDNLIREGVSPRDIYVSGNTVIDALNYAVDKIKPMPSDEANRRILLTVHRRENLDSALASILSGVHSLALKYPDVDFDFPMHPNPRIRNLVIPALGQLQNVNLLEPLSYLELVEKMARSYLVLTDSGGLQEEAPALGKPVLVLRDNTERPEGLAAGTAKLVGTQADEIIAHVSDLLDSQISYDRMAKAINPYGDGKASERCESAILAMLGGYVRLPEFGL